MSSLNGIDHNKQGSSSLIPGGFSCSHMDSNDRQMQHAFESNYGLVNPQQMGVANAGWKAFFCRPSDNLCSSSSTSPKAVTPEASADFYHSGAVSEVAGPDETLMVAPEAAAWRPGRLLADDSSLRCLLPGVGVEQQRQGLSLSLCNAKPSDIRLQQQTIGVGEETGSQSNIRDWLLPKTTSFHTQHPQQQQQPLLQESQFFPQLCIASSSSGFCSQPLQQLGNSKYLAPVQELLIEFCSLGAGNNKDEEKKKTHRQLEEGGSSSSPTQWSQPLLSLDVVELKKRLAKLVSMLEELDRRYRKYCEQMKAVVTSFEAVAGEGAATVYSTLASRAMSRHFRCLRDGIVVQMSETKRAIGEKDPVAPGTTRGETPRLRLLDHYMRQQKVFQHAGTLDAHPWRPQRGLPERSVSVLRAWLFEHFLHPYPSDVDKHILARQTGLSRSQVCNWFINARVRLWKPMVEEMYSEETKEQDLQTTHGNMGQQDDRQPGQSQNPNPGDTPERQLQDDQKPRPMLLGGSDSDSLSSVVNSTHNSVRGQAMVGKEPRYPPPPRAYQHQLQQLARPDDNFGLLDMDFSSYNECSGAQQHFGNGVSLTLGLQQHNGASMSLSFTPSSHSSLVFSKEAIDNYQPMHLSIIDGDAQNPPYRNLMGAQLLHDLSGN